MTCSATIFYALESALGSMNLVTRKAFEIQKPVLARPREKLKALETRIGRPDVVERAAARLCPSVIFTNQLQEGSTSQ